MPVTGDGRGQQRVAEVIIDSRTDRAETRDQGIGTQLVEDATYFVVEPHPGFARRGVGRPILRLC